jgi:hypothetical protein
VDASDAGDDGSRSDGDASAPAEVSVDVSSVPADGLFVAEDEDLVDDDLVDDVLVDDDLVDDDLVDDDLVDWDSVDEESSDDVDVPADGSANAMPGVHAMATPTPSVTANAPTRPMCLA